jgi:ribose 5-phosphate isomerase A
MDAGQRNQAKQDVGVAAAQLVEPGMLVGLGTGSTAHCFIEALAKRVAQGLRIEAVATSRHSEELARSLSIPMRPLATVSAIDLTIDGADCINPHKWMVKGGGGALLREKILAAASHELVVIIDADKWSEQLLGPLPIEIVPFCHRTTLKRLETAGFDAQLRLEKEQPYVTDNGNFIAHLQLNTIDDAPGLHQRLKSLIGIVETGLFFDLARRVLVGHGNGRVEVR